MADTDNFNFNKKEERLALITIKAARAKTYIIFRP